MVGANNINNQLRMVILILKRLFCKHRVKVRIDQRWLADTQDEYHATNYGGLVKYKLQDIFRCVNCGEIIFKDTGERKIG